MELYEWEQRSPIVLMHHLEVNLEKDIIDTTVPASSVSLPQNSINALDTLWKAV